MSFCWSIQMQLHTDIGSQICDLGLISSNECQNDRSSCLDLKLEINSGFLQMGIDDIQGYAIYICRVQKYYPRKNKILQLHSPCSQKVQKTIKEEIVLEEKPCIVKRHKTQVSIREELGSLLVGINPEGKMLLTLLSNLVFKE